MYMVSDWLVDGINNKLYKFTNDILEESYEININNPIGDAGVAVCTDEATIAVTCPTAGMVAWFDIGTKRFIKYTTVGGTPIGICEGIPYGDDPTPPFFVANYSTNTVSVIKNGNVVQTINVGKGPRSVATDGYGRIYVTNFNSATVSILSVTDNSRYSVYKTIEVDNYPNCVAVNHNDDAFVVCQSSIVKLRKDHSKVKFTVTGNPINITADAYGNMWFTNLTNNSVMRLTLQEKILTFISGGVGPVYISSDKTGDIICLNTGDKTLTRINETGDVINTVQLDFIPMANGDFTGFISRVNILDDIKRKDDKKIGLDDLDDELREKIEGGVDPDTLFIKSDNITYTNAGFTNVTEAINSLIYEYSNILVEDINKFEIDPPIYEKGSVVTTVRFNYDIANVVDHSLAISEINNGVGVIPLEAKTYVISGLNITENKDYKLILTNSTMNRGEKIATVKFDNKIYYGVKPEIITTAGDILNIPNFVFVEDNDENTFNRELEFSNANGYLYIAIPSSLNISIYDLLVNNLRDSNWETLELNFTNTSGYSEMYTLFRSGYTHNLTNQKLFVSINHSK